MIWGLSERLLLLEACYMLGLILRGVARMVGLVFPPLSKPCKILFSLCWGGEEGVVFGLATFIS